MTEPTQAQPFEDRRVEAIDLDQVEERAKASYISAGANFPSQIPWEKWTQSPKGRLRHYVAAALSLQPPHPATVALAEAVELLRSWDTEDDYTFGTAINAFLARHGGK